MSVMAALPLRKAGFLTKKCRHRRGWERRYFVLTHSSLHRYIRRPEDELFGTLRDSLPLASIAAVERCDEKGLPSLARGVGDQSCHFTIRLKRGSDSADGSPATGRESSSPRRRRGQETLVLRAASTEERDEWLIQLDGLLHHAFDPSAPRSRDRTSISGTYPAAQAAAAALRRIAPPREVSTRGEANAVDVGANALQDLAQRISICERLRHLRCDQPRPRVQPEVSAVLDNARGHPRSQRAVYPPLRDET